LKVEDITPLFGDELQIYEGRVPVAHAREKKNLLRQLEKASLEKKRRLTNR